ncbi:unnamed protein product [Adineta steineri]|uniref:Uncharacterized protein n=1 Tax=Adineta steineri TaxID=433720 RepID=A0A819DXX1_9BILA|nr:unnamed protein product [Adineta steineri]CAF3840968.1 unnamed protein product [Adineta steineri]
MTFTSNEISETKNDEVNSSSSSGCTHSMDHEEIEHIDKSLSTKANEEQQFSVSSDYIDALVDCCKLQISINLFPLYEEKPS